MRRNLRSREGTPKSDYQCEALVFFGATGDLAYKKIFPSLQAMIKRGTLNIPIIGVAKSGWSLDGLQERARRTIECSKGRSTAVQCAPKNWITVWRRHYSTGTPHSG
jgi:glucose-6-phosphate 1-dehydrogenase